MNIKAVEQAIKDEIANPQKCYLPNCPELFVKSRLQRQGLHEEAKWFWNTVVYRSKFNVEKIDALIPQLNSLNANERMPEWGTRGT